eukprot:m.1379613 g.1379613  ORF g.1379613 m.1379613 type:complete len:93 (-) comp24966_c0_seq8:235-513(-)
MTSGSLPDAASPQRVQSEQHQLAWTPCCPRHRPSGSLGMQVPAYALPLLETREQSGVTAASANQYPYPSPPSALLSRMHLAGAVFPAVFRLA